jgi:histidinol-phosphatase (PHP family)
MILDYHLHTPLCRHAAGEPEEYARRAVERGVEEIGFSDHSPMPPGYDPDWRMGEAEFGTYLGLVERCRRAFPKLSIKLGLEGDFHPGTEGYVRQLLRRAPFDYVIGSVHYLGDWGFDNPENAHRFEGRDVYEIYETYYRLVEGLAESRLFDIVGHPDVIKKFGHRPSRDYEGLERRALEAVARAGMALDVNTSGLRRPAREVYPSLRILKLARELGIGITLGSDAHDPRHVGESFKEALDLVRAAGYTQLRRYRARSFDLVPLA